MVVLLPLAKILIWLTAVLSTRDAGSLSALDVEDVCALLVFLSPTVGWAWILGNAAGRAVQHWLDGRCDLARATLLKTGFWCTLLNSCWCCIDLLWAISDEAPVGLTLWKEILLVLGTNAAWQASVLVLLAGSLLPGTEANRVQVTENLRL